MECRRRAVREPPLFPGVRKYISDHSVGIRTRLSGTKRSAQRAIARLRNVILKYTVGYGYYPALSLVWLLALVVAGFALYRAGYYAGTIAPTDKEAYAYFDKTGEPPEYYQHFHAFLYSLENSFPIVKLGQTDRWQSRPNRTHEVLWGAKHRFLASPVFLLWFSRIQILLGWFFGTMGIASVTGMVRKD